jgi:sugar-specific transcriptional regulator TrmB
VLRTVFESIGLPPADARLYEAMVGLPPATSAELAAAADMTPVTITRTAARLLRRGLIRRLAGHPVRYIAVAPEIAVGAMIHDHEQGLLLAREDMRRLSEVHHSARRFTQPAELVEVIEGRDNVTGLHRRLVDAAERELCYFSTPPYFSTNPGDDPHEAERIRSGIAFRVIYDAETVADPARLASIRANVRAGEHARTVSELPMEMLVVDERQALLPIDGEAIDAAYLIHASSLLAALTGLFASIWAQATPLYLASRRIAVAQADDALVPELLALLAAGLSDKAIGRHLGWSPRTLQRRIHDLMRSLDAGTRFQAGVVARERGWIRPSH